MDTNLEKKPRSHHRGVAGGIILILIGSAILLQRWLDIENYIVLLLGLTMLVWGSVSHKGGLIIPGGVLTGIGLGILAMQGPWQFPLADQNGVFLLCFALGWFLITILTALSAHVQWWPLIPGGIMALIGGGILVTNGAFPWIDLNLVFAAILIVLGLILLVTWGRTKKND
jgi:hypothetical protein